MFSIFHDFMKDIYYASFRLFYIKNGLPLIAYSDF